MTMKGILGAAVLGGAGYPLLEIIFRGRTHKTMALAGAVCLPMLRLCARLPLCRPVRALVGMAGITTCEGLIGAVCNRDYRIWDYRKNRGNVKGQVCLKFCLLWYGIAYLLTYRRKTRKIC